jgi:hypothetical protein
LLTFVYDILHLSNIIITKDNENSQFRMHNNDLHGVVVPVHMWCAARKSERERAAEMDFCVWSRHIVTMKEK